MMLRLVSRLPVYTSALLVLAGAGWAWAEDGAAASGAPAEAAGEATAADQAAAQETASEPEPTEAEEELPPAELFESLPRFGEGVFALPAAKEVGRQPEAPEAPAPGTVTSAGAPPANLPVPPNYIIGPGDRLSLRVWSNDWEQVSEIVTVSPEGV